QVPGSGFESSIDWRVLPDPSVRRVTVRGLSSATYSAGGWFVRCFRGDRARLFVREGWAGGSDRDGESFTSEDEPGETSCCEVAWGGSVPGPARVAGCGRAGTGRCVREVARL